MRCMHVTSDCTCNPGSRTQIVQIDPDLFKVALPEWDEYCRRDPLTAGRHTRQETGMCCEIAQEASMRMGKHIVRALPPPYRSCTCHMHTPYAHAPSIQIVHTPRALRC